MKKQENLLYTLIGFNIGSILSFIWVYFYVYKLMNLSKSIEMDMQAYYENEFATEDNNAK